MSKDFKFPKKTVEEIFINNSNYVIASELSFYNNSFVEELKKIHKNEPTLDINFNSHVPRINIFDVFTICYLLKKTLSVNDILKLLNLYKQFRSRDFIGDKNLIYVTYLTDLNEILDNIMSILNNESKALTEGTLTTSFLIQIALDTIEELKIKLNDFAKKIENLNIEVNQPNLNKESFKLKIKDCLDTFVKLKEITPKINDYIESNGIIYTLNSNEITINLLEPLSELYDKIKNLKFDADDLEDKLENNIKKNTIEIQPQNKIKGSSSSPLTSPITVEKETTSMTTLYVIIVVFILIIVVIVVIIFKSDDKKYIEHLEIINNSKNSQNNTKRIDDTKLNTQPPEITELKISNQPKLGVDIFGDLEVNV